jgi:arylsulfatase A-like enzyme
VRTERYLYIRNELPQYPRTPPADAVRSPTYISMQKLHAEGKLSPEQATCFTTTAPREELYDVIADPHSLKNLAQDEKHAATREALRRRLAEWVEETKDAVPPQPTPDKFDRATGLPLK